MPCDTLQPSTPSSPVPLSPAGLAHQVSRGRWRAAPHLELADWALMMAAGGHLPRLVFQMPVRHGKSELASVHFPLWYLLTYPERQVILAGATDDLAAAFSLRVRDLLAEFGPALTGVSVRQDRHTANAWEVVGPGGRPTGGGLRAAGVGAAIVGRGADLLVCDDLIRSAEDAQSPARREAVHRWFAAVATTRLGPGAPAVLVGTPWHSDDLFGRLRSAEERGGERWSWLRLPALSEGEGDPLGRPAGAPLWPERFSLAWLEARRAAYSAEGQLRYWHALYQCKPLAGDGSTEWPEDYFGDQVWFADWPPPDQVVRSVLAIDGSKGKLKGDPQALVLTRLDRQGRFWVDAEEVRLDEQRLLAKALECLEKWQPTVCVVETNGAGYYLLGQLSRALVRGTRPAVVGRQHGADSNKLARINTRLTSQWALGTIRLRRGSPGTRLLLQQARDFPNGQHDDLLDALEMGMELHGELNVPRDKRVIKYEIPR
jgi:hypothetical protein